MGVERMLRMYVGQQCFVVKNLFGMKKVRYKVLVKNTVQLFMLFGLANLLIAKRRLFALNAQDAS
jgi:IS5 family transposase